MYSMQVSIIAARTDTRRPSHCHSERPDNHGSSILFSTAEKYVSVRPNPIHTRAVRHRIRRAVNDAASRSACVR